MSFKNKVFFNSLYGLGFSILLGVLLCIRAEKGKLEFYKVTGKLLSITNSNQLLSIQDTLKKRYLIVDGYPKVFEIFIGKDFGDFKPKFEKIDDLRPSDEITIYYDENFQTQGAPINKLAYFIDRADETIFIKGSWEKKMGFFLIGTSILILIVISILKLKGKIS